MEFKADKAYPTPDEIKEDHKSLRVISPAYAGGRGELTAVLQYVYHSIVLERIGFTEISKDILGIAVNEMHHLELLGSAIAALGAPPIFTACPPYPVCYYSASHVNYAKTPEEMLDSDIEAETQAIEDYKQIVSRLCNPPLVALVERIIEDEELHLSRFKEMRKELSKRKNHP